MVIAYSRNEVCGWKKISEERKSDKCEVINVIDDVIENEEIERKWDGSEMQKKSEHIIIITQKNTSKISLLL